MPTLMPMAQPKGSFGTSPAMLENGGWGHRKHTFISLSSLSNDLSGVKQQGKNK